MNWPNTRLTERLRIRYPIIQAPMAGGATTAELVAAVSNAGGLGSFAGGYLQPEEIRAAINEIRTLTDRPFAVNLFVPAPVKEDGDRIDRANALLAAYREELGMTGTAPHWRELPKFSEQLAVILEEAVEVFSFTFGVPRAEELEALQQRGIVTLGTATHLLEAIVLEESGVDMVVAQGIEAGGHRGTFVGPPEQGLVGTLALIPVLPDHLRIPFIAAGGIMGGRGIAAAMALGADGVQMGTAFLTCPESGAPPAHKEILNEGTEITTVLTRAFTGKLARGIKNRFVSEMQPHEAELPGYPIQHVLTRDIRQTAARRNRSEFMALWAGQGCALCHKNNYPAGELIAEWTAQVAKILNR